MCCNLVSRIVAIAETADSGSVDDLDTASASFWRQHRAQQAAQLKAKLKKPAADGAADLPPEPIRITLVDEVRDIPCGLMMMDLADT